MNVSNYGKVSVCPNCGANVSPHSLKCEECGHIFQGIEALDIVREFENKLNAANILSRSGVIKRFPIPNSQEALFAFIEYLRPLCESPSINPVEGLAYMAKFEECMTRAKIAFPNHPTVIEYDKINKRKKRVERNKLIWGGVGLIGFIGFIWFTCVFLPSEGGRKGNANEPNQITTELQVDETSSDIVGDEEVETQVDADDEADMDADNEVAPVVELPEGWEKISVMSGKYEYCAAKFRCAGGDFSVEIYKDGIIVSFASSKDPADKLTDLKIGKVSDTVISDAAGVATFRFLDEQEIAALADFIASGKNEAYIEQEGKTYKAKLTGKAAKSIMDAIKWAESNPIAMDVL